MQNTNPVYCPEIDNHQTLVTQQFLNTFKGQFEYLSGNYATPKYFRALGKFVKDLLDNFGSNPEFSALRLLESTVPSALDNKKSIISDIDTLIVMNQLFKQKNKELKIENIFNEFINTYFDKIDKLDILAELFQSNKKLYEFIISAYDTLNKSRSVDQKDGIQPEIKAYFGDDHVSKLNRVLKEINNDCPVCFDTLTESQLKDQQILVTKCAHVFHKVCLQDCCKLKSECPKCRKVVQLEGDLKHWQKIERMIHDRFLKAKEAPKKESTDQLSDDRKTKKLGDKNKSIEQSSKPLRDESNKASKSENVSSGKEEQITSNDEEIAKKLWHELNDSDGQIESDLEFAKKLQEELNKATE
jgi:hypothetical protein